MEQKKGRPPWIKEVVKPSLEPSEGSKLAVSSEILAYREVLLKTLTEDVGIPEQQATEIADKYNRLSVLAKAIKDGVTFPISAEAFLKLKKLCLCR
jgi:hypothetical protein